MDKKYRTFLKALCKSVLANKCDWRQERAEWVNLINDRAENGKVLLLSSGMDCDGGAWQNRGYVMDAVPVKILRFIEREYEWADGPISFSVERPSRANQYEEIHKDLGLEAFENGHQHVYRW